MTDVRHAGLAALALLAIVPFPALAQRSDAGIADRALATREELEAVASRLGDPPRDAALAGRVRTRLQDGDFRPGDRVLIDVQGDTALSDTFAVWPDQSLRLPSPAVGALSLKGVLRAELQTSVERFVSRFVRAPVVRARALVRVSIQGEVAHAGYYAVPAESELSSVFMAAGGTTTNANLNRARVERDGRAWLNGRSLQDALASGQTLDEAGIRSGDQFVLPRRGSGLRDNLGMVWLVLSITGGAIALSRAIN